jgi:hypothetical protein
MESTLSPKELETLRDLSAKRRRAAVMSHEASRETKRRNAVITARRNAQIRAEFGRIVDRGERGGVRNAIDTLSERYCLSVKSIERAVYDLN